MKTKFKFLMGSMVVLMLLVGLTGVASAVTGAGFTNVNESLDGTGHCQNGNPNINCNIYDGKQYVWLNGGPNRSSRSERWRY